MAAKVAQIRRFRREITQKILVLFQFVN